MGTTFGPGDWLQTIGNDLLTFAPFFALMVGIAFIVAFPIATQLSNRLNVNEAVLLPIAGVVGLSVAILAANWLSPVATLVPATRQATGFVTVALTGALGGVIHATMGSERRVAAQGRKSTALILGGAAVVLLMAFGLHLLTRPNRATEIEDVELDNYRVAIVADGLEHPWGMAFLPDGRKLVSERPGRLRVIDNTGAMLAEPVRGVPEVFVAREAGLMDIKLSPDYGQDGFIYLTYSCGSEGSVTTCVSRGRLRDHAFVNEERIFEALPQRPTTVQFGSRMAFLADGSLVLTLGDGFDYREQAQMLDNHFGKLVRLNPDGTVPSDNPFVSEAGALPGIYSYGHRNPQGIWFDEERGLLLESEHGPYGGDEINIIEPGVNYGWPLATEGINYPGDRVSPHDSISEARRPVKSWTPSIAPSGILVYRGSDFPSLSGNLLVSALAGRGVLRLTLQDGEVIQSSRLFHELKERIRHTLVSPEGKLYLLTDSDSGQILRIDSRNPTGPDSGNKL